MSDTTVTGPAPNPGGPPNRGVKPGPASPQEAPRQPTIDNNWLFGCSVAILLVILGLGFMRESLQYNLLFLMTLSLGVSAFMAFLPLAVTLELQWIKAGGSAAILVFLASQFVPYAKEEAVRRVELAARGNDPFFQCIEIANKHFAEAFTPLAITSAAAGNIGGPGQSPAMDSENLGKIKQRAPEALRLFSAGQAALAGCPIRTPQPKPDAETKQAPAKK